MKIALLSRGPSLEQTWDGSKWRYYNAIIGVNNVVEKHRCDWWCFRDSKTFADVPDVIGRPKIFTGQRFLVRLGKRHADHLPRTSNFTIIEHEDYVFPDPLRGLDPWYRWSGTAALGLACKLACNTGKPETCDIDCYGVDMMGDDDFKGVKTASRNEQRWARERALWSAMSSRIRQMGISLSIFSAQPSTTARASGA